MKERKLDALNHQEHFELVILQASEATPEKVKELREKGFIFGTVQSEKEAENIDISNGNVAVVLR